MSSRFTTGTAPGAVPLLGHAWQLARHPLDFLDSLPTSGDLVCISLGPRKAYVPCHPELLHQVLADDRTFDKGGPVYQRLSELFGNGLGSCPHRDHRRQRKILQPAFHKSRLEHYSAAMTASATALAESWHDGQVLDVFPALFAYSLRTIVGSIFSAELDQAAVEEIRRALRTVLRGVMLRALLPAVFLNLPTPGNRRYRGDLAAFNMAVGTLITRHRTAPPDGPDILSDMLAHQQNDASCPLSDQEIHDEVVDLLVAATEAVASSLTWTLHLLSAHAAAQDRLHSEIAHATHGRPAGWADLPALGYTDQVIGETLRLYPAGWLFTRLTTRTTELAGQPLPAGTVIVVSPIPVNRNESFHTDPRAFNPDRGPGSSSLPARKTVVPFGGGARRCIGDSYATTVIKLTLAAIVSRWHVAPAAGTDARPAPLTPNLRPRRVALRLIAHSEGVMGR